MYKKKVFAWLDHTIICSFLGVFFMMMPLAVFASADVPTVQITTPTPSQNTTNGNFTVSGRTSDNVAVAAVYYSLNGAPWTNTTTLNNWTNWSAALPLVPGTNSLKAFALDTSGNASTTNSVSFEYVVPMPLSVQVFGLGVPNPKWGSLSAGYTTTFVWIPGYGYYATSVQLPGYTNGSLLAVNENYVITAVPAPGFAFTNWSDGNGNLLTNGPTLSFTMAANLALVANFVDVTRPTLSITAPTLNQPWSNGTFTATGKANANVAVANVFYSLNGAPWTNATTLNNWTNWSASLPLVPGTNSLKAYALDASGNASTTNAVSFEYVVPMPLSVQVFGLGVPNPKWGSLSGGYTTTSIFIPGYGYYTTSAWLPGYTNGSLLAVNENYVITAIPASGFAFTNWSDGNGNLLTNGPTLRFTMAANLALVANFVDVTRPTLSIVSPTPNQQRSNGMFTATGKAGDNVAVANIFYSLNGAPWSAATTLDNWTNWSASLPPVPGTNTLQAFALDSSGNASTTNAVSFEYVVPMPLSVQVFGLGVPNPKWGSFNSSYTTTYVWIPGYGYYPTTVRLPGYTNGTLLAVNENYVITAVPSPGFVFTNWTDGSGNLLTNNATLQFTMATNLALVANFVDVQKPTVSILSPTPNQSSLWIGTGVQNQPDESIVSVAPGIMNATAPQGPQGVAGSAQNIPYEYWISTNATGNYFTNATHYSGGTLDNPFDGSTQQAFDLNMSKMPANSVIHLLPGIYQTLGSNPAGWGVKDNQRILGSGMNLTVLQHPAWEVTNHSLIDGYSVVGSQASPTNVDLENFTVDGNYYRSNYPAGDYASIDGITLFGSYNTVNNVRVINLAAYAPTNGYKEAWGITINPYHGSDHNLIENCEVSHFTATNSCNLSAITIWGSGVITGNTVIQEEPCDTTYGIEELSGSISGNITVGCSIFSYMDNGNNNINNLSVSNNSILYGQFGIVWMNVSESNVKISNNFFVMSNCTSLWAPYNFISCVVLTPHNSGGVTNFYNVQFSGNMVENVSSNALELSLFNAAGGIGLDISGNAIESCFSNILTGCAGVAISGNYELNGNYLAVTGTAGDNGAVAAVYYSLNGGLWTNASTANNWTNWTGSLALTPGTNTIQAYAEDTSGNLSLTNAVKYVYVVPRPLNVSINGKGSVTPNDNGVLLLVNENYTLTADAAAGFVFTNWTDGSGNLLTNNATLQFTMATNLALVANFVDVQKPTVSILSPTPNQSSLWIGTGVQNQPDESIVSVAPGIMNATAPQGPQGVAGSAQNIPYEYWISTNATGNYFTNATHYSGGTLDNPFDGSTQQAFDLNMSKMPANSVIHLLPGIYQTLGSNPAGWGVKDNQRILGSGMNLTVLQHPAWEVTNHSLIDGYSVVGSQASPTNVDLENFTVDGNYYRSNYPAGDYASIDGITLFGSYNTVNNVRVINLAAYAPTNGYKEAWGITINPYHGSDHNLIENCEVSHFTATNICDLSAIAIWGSGVMTGNTVIQEEPCDTTYGFEELSGSISGNITVGCSIFSYMDNGNNNINNLSVSNNSILYGQFGIAWMNVSESNVKISNNFFVMSNGTSLWAPYNFISCVVLTPHNSGGVTNFYNVQFSGNMVENVSSNALELSLFNAAGGIGLDISGNAIESCFSNILTGCAGVAISGNYELNGNYLAVTGTAGDNGAVAAVYYSLNGGLWTNASTANNWTNWTGSLALTPGTNTIQAYAEDTSGNLSLTNAVKYVYVVPRPLNVSINGKGSVTPNDNGVLLLVNENYTLTADAAAGFVFTNWTDGSGNLLTNNATLQFTMATNLALVANFVDVQKPTLSIATPTVNQQLTNGTFTVSGKAGDNVAVASVYYSLNGGPWTNATSANNWTNWTRSLTLTPDTNIIQAFAVDTSGNLSPTNTVEFVYVVPKPMVVYPAASARLAPASLVPTSFVNGQFALTVLGVTNYRCIVQASANLVDWIPVQTNTAPFTYVDTNAGKFKQHFYRTVYIQ
jgi:hypothetical protein